MEVIGVDWTNDKENVVLAFSIFADHFVDVGWDLVRFGVYCRFFGGEQAEGVGMAKGQAEEQKGDR